MIKHDPSDFRRMTKDEWLTEGRQRFGEDMMQWKFVCPICKHIASAEDWKTAGATNGEAAFSCVGRHMNPPPRTAFGPNSQGPGPCDYAGGGLFQMNPIVVTFPDGTEHQIFEFASIQ